MKLTAEQITYIENYIKSFDIKYYEVYMEILDHMILSVEAILEENKEITKGELNITEGALYPALHKLEAEGLLDVEVEKVDNRLRKYYKLTEKGTTETVNRLAELEEFIKNMQTIVNPKLSY